MSDTLIIKKDLLTLSGLTERDLATIRQIFNNYADIKSVRIFGSRSNGTYHSGSDIDLAIMNEIVDKRILFRLKGEFEESSLPYFVDLVIFSNLSNDALSRHIQEEGIMIYNCDEY